jgi:hypothetical protein
VASIILPGPNLREFELHFTPDFLGGSGLRPAAASARVEGLNKPMSIAIAAALDPHAAEGAGSSHQRRQRALAAR